MTLPTFVDGQILYAVQLNAMVAAINVGGNNTIIDHGASSTGTLTIDVTTSRVHKVVLQANVTTFAVTVLTTSDQYVAALIAMTQGGSGSVGVTFPANFRWQGGFSPSLSTAIGATDVLQVSSFDGGATWIASIALQAAPT